MNKFLSSQIITKEAAKSQGINRYFDNTICRNGHNSDKYVRDGYCCTCKTLGEHRNKEKRAISKKLRYNKNRKKYIDINSLYTKQNKERVASRQAIWRDANKDKIKKYRIDNAWLYTFHSANRRYKIKRATPVWANMEAIKQFYLQAAKMSATTGIPHEVDHIIPLSNNIVSGLHCEFNLQVLTKTDNLLKSNSYSV